MPMFPRKSRVTTRVTIDMACRGRQRPERVCGLGGRVRPLGSYRPRHAEDRLREITFTEVPWIIAPLLPKPFRAGIVMAEQEVGRLVRWMVPVPDFQERVDSETQIPHRAHVNTELSIQFELIAA